jgi:pheromone shutdown protein TraB
MLYNAFLTIIILISPLRVQDRLSNTTGTGDRDFYLIGTAHHMHFEDRYHYSVIDLEAQVRSLHPDVVCGEITPQALNGPMEGNFPPEAAMLAEMAPRWGAHFVPADWRVSFAWQRRGERQEAENKSKAAEVEAAQNKVKAYYEGFPGGTLYDYTNGSAQYLKMIDHVFEEVIGENTPSDIAAGAWHERNRMIVDNCLEGAVQARRVVFVFGSSHLPQLQRQLAARNLKGQIPPRAYTPAGLGAVSSEVIARWERNLKNLENVANGSVAVSADDRAKVIDTNRAPELRNEIALYLAREKAR